MNWYLLGLLLLVLGMMTWPILLLKPNPQEKKIAQLHGQAKALGLKIKPTKLQLPAQFQQNYAFIDQAVAFSLPVNNSVLPKRYSALRSMSSGEWFWPTKERPAASVMQKMVDLYQQLPSSCVAVEQSAAESVLYVLGGTFAMDEIAGYLQKLNEIIQKEPFSAINSN